MAGFLKKIFSFGFGKKKELEEPKAAEAEAEPVVEEVLDAAAAEPDPVKEVSTKTTSKKPVEKKTKATTKKTKPKSKDGNKVKPATKPVQKPEKKAQPGRTKNLQKPEINSKTTIAEPTPVAEKTAKSKIATKPSGKITLDEAPTPAPVPEIQPEDDGKKGWFSRLKNGLSRTSTQLTENVTSIFTKRKLDDETLEELEDVLIQADLGVDTAIRVTASLADQRYGKDVSDEEVREIMATEIEKVLGPVAMPLELDLDHKPHVILVIGVNGSGKTTTIGKLSAKLKKAGLSTLLVAGDTFRAAAIEQLKIWGERTGSPVASRELGSDAAGLAFDAYDQARDGGHDVMLMDTAGRLQNKTELMDELEKIIRVLKKQNPTAPHTVLLTLDATTGQNALNQVEIFREKAGVNGLVMTKLDGTARGGILVSISATHKLPVYFIGVGEQVEDLEPFEAGEFARSIAGLN